MLPLDSLPVWHWLEEEVDDLVLEFDEDAENGSKMVVKEYYLLVTVHLFLVQYFEKMICM